jgi:hypothetical protein
MLGGFGLYGDLPPPDKKAEAAAAAAAAESAAASAAAAAEASSGGSSKAPAGGLYGSLPIAKAASNPAVRISPFALSDILDERKSQWHLATLCRTDSVGGAGDTRTVSISSVGDRPREEGRQM